jgi:hypothetical protein
MAAATSSPAQMYSPSFAEPSHLERAELFVASLSRNPRSFRRIFSVSATGRDTSSGGHGHDFSKPSFFVDKKNNDGAISAIAIAARPTFGEEGVNPCRSEQLLENLKALNQALCKVGTLTQKINILNSCPGVKAVFGHHHHHHHIGNVGFYPNPIVSLATETLGEYELYLLKCLVAAGQEHVLDAPLEWFHRIENATLPSETGSSINGKAHYGTSEAQMLSSYEEDDLPINGKCDHGNGSESYPEPINGMIKDHNESHVVNGTVPLHSLTLKTMLQKLIKSLHEIESFYDSIGGIIG